MADFDSITEAQFQTYIQNYSSSDRTTVRNLFGIRVAGRFRVYHKTTRCLSFTNNQKGKKFMDLLFSAADYWGKLPKNADTDGFRVYLGMTDDNQRVDILSLTEWGLRPGKPGYYLIDTGEFYQININIRYDDIIQSTEDYEKTQDGKTFFSWHCEPHCPE
jgi:hypothetical protein